MNILFVANDIRSALNIIKPALAMTKGRSLYWSVTENHNVINTCYDVVFLLSYRKIIPESVLDRVHGKVVVFHSSDMPAGRGWAPIYTAINSGKKIHTITMCYAAKEVDAGLILAKARSKIHKNYTASMLRKIGQAMISYLIGRYALRFDGEKPPGTPQKGISTYIKRRTFKDGGINPRKTFKKIIPHLLASEETHPAFFIHENETFYLNVVSANQWMDTSFLIEEYFDGRKGKTVIIKDWEIETK